MKNSWESYEEAAERGPVSLAVKVVGTVIVLALIFGAAGHFLHWCDSSTEVVDKTLNADNVIYNYEYFKQSYQDIQALDKQIVDAQVAADRFDGQFKSRKEMDRDDKNESDRLHAILDGLRQQRLNQVATYNARSQMVNRNIFKSGDLPSHIN